MRSIVLTPVLLSALFFASCSVSYTTRTAKIADITNCVVQMPTVVDLRVDDNVIKSDTVWKNRPFNKDVVSVKSQIDNVTASLLARVGADVLVQPAVEHEVSRNGSTTTHRISVSGYPAYYEKFRTITADDVKVIDALTGKSHTANRPLLTDYSIARPLGSLNTNTGKRVQPLVKPNKTATKAVTKRERYQRKPGYCGMLDGGYEFFSGLGSLSTTHGYQFGHYFFLGAGVECLTYDFGYFEVPVYLDLRGYLLNRRVSPYIEARLGIEPLETIPYLSAGIGISIGHFQIGAAYRARYGSRCMLTAGFKF